jgi:tellurite resistance protein
MGMKDAFSADEWKNLLSLPYAVGMTIIIVSPQGPMGMYKETKEMALEPTKLASTSGSGLVSTLSVELQQQAKELMKEQQNLFKQNQANYKNLTIEACKSAASTLSKTTADEAKAYKQWVLNLGQKVAEAAKEGGVAVTDQEKAALNEISVALGLSA